MRRRKPQIVPVAGPEIVDFDTPRMGFVLMEPVG